MARQPPLFVVAAILFIGAALFHFYGLVTSLGDSKLAAFHATFVVVDPVTAFFLLRRPDWFPYAFAVLTVQQIYSHGVDALNAWRDTASIDVISLFIIVFMPVLLVFLIYDAVNRKSQTQ